MRSLSIVLALAMVMATSLVFVAPTSRAPALSRLFVTIEAGHADQNVFTPATIVLPSVPIILNVTVINNSTDINMLHTFSIRDNTGTKHIEITVPHPGDNASVEFAVNSSNQIYYGGQLFRAEAGGTGIKFFCSPHEPVGMVGSIVVGGVTPPPSPELGIFLRAYWIGIIGLIAMLVWVGITYFLIKASSRHNTDQRDHIRRGLP